MANLQDRYDNVGVVVKLRPDESEYVVCAVVGAAEVPFAVVSIAKLNKLIDAVPVPEPVAAPEPAPAAPGDSFAPPQQ